MLFVRLLGAGSLLRRPGTQRQLEWRVRTLGRTELVSRGPPLALALGDDAAVRHAHERAAHLFDVIRRGVTLAAVSTDDKLLVVVAVFARHQQLLVLA